MSQPVNPSRSTPPAAVGGGTFQVDMSRAPQAIRELEVALAELKDIQREAFVLGQVNPPARDPVSLDAARVLAETGTSGPNSFLQALGQGVAELENMIEALQSGFDAYERGDVGARASFQRSS